MDAAYRDYTNDVCGFLRARRTDAEQLIRDYTVSLWRATAAGWNKGTSASQVVANWCVGADPIVRDPINTKRETRKQVWEKARLA